MTKDAAPGARMVLALVFLSACTAFAVDISLPALPELARVTGSDLGAAQRTIGVFILGYAIGQIPMGLLGDRFGRRPVLLIVMTMFVVFGVTTSLTENMTTLLVLRFCQGVCAASGAALSRAVVRDVTDGPKTAQLLTFLSGMNGVAMIVAPMLGTLALMLAGWRGPFVASALWGLVGLLLCVVYVPETRKPQQGASLFRTLLRGVTDYVKSVQAWLAAALAGVCFAGVMTHVTLSPVVFMEGLGYTPAQFSIYFAIIASGFVAGAILAIRWAAGYTLPQLLARIAATLLLICAGLLIAALIGGLVPALVVMFLAIGVMGATIGLSHALALQNLGHVAGVAAGLTGTLQLLFGAAFSFLVTFRNIDSLNELLSIYGILALNCVGLIAVLLLGRWVA